MKIRDLQRKSGEAVVSVWPPQWGSWYKAGDKFAVGEEGVLKSFKRVEDRLSLTMEFEGREHSSSIKWDEPPTLAAVEKVLQAHLEQLIKEISDMDVDV
jgi:hypothetical protein